ncbi:MAG: glucoamylase [Ectothiorhodospiraceae bacterium]|nr:glucoamylase [Ectothiorhodospiraceae bacterium]
MSYQPIENYGIIGDMHSVALVGKHGSIDWLCFPKFDSPSIFASLLDSNIGGHFKIMSLAEGVNEKQFYWPDTNVLVTRFLCDDGVGEVTDFMPIHNLNGKHGAHQIIRRVQVVRGEMEFVMECLPAFDYARAKHETHIAENGAIFKSDALTVALVTKQDLEKYKGGARSIFRLSEGESASFILHECEKDAICGPCLTEEQTEEHFQRTVRYWRKWLSQSEYTGRWREMVNRSALVLKLLTYRPTGAIVASPTTSLPEEIGGERNWDYRYTWIRDAAFTLYGLLRIGFTEEAADFMHWIEARANELEPDGSLQIMYSIDGDHTLTEETLDHLEGYKGSKPVRIGNGAYNQLQLDIYGELMDSVYLFNKYGSPISYDLWCQLRRMINWIADHWHLEDEGIWEVRGGKRHFVYSKLMAWVAVDRGLRLADKRSFPADRKKWLQTRDEIYEDIMAKGYSKNRKAFVQSYGSDSLDASNLIMPLVFFVSPTDRRMLNTLDAILQPVDKGGLTANSLVYRYNLKEYSDGLSGEEGTFNICTFWLVEAMTRAGRHDPKRLDEARLMFERMLGYANHLGLYSEETGSSGEALGNFPQAFTHLALISAAYNLDRALGEGE